MEGDRSKSALARIEAALARIEAAPGHVSGGSDAELAALQARHRRLREAIQDGLNQLDSLIEGGQG